MKVTNRAISTLLSLVTMVSMTSMVATAANTSDTAWLGGNEYCRYKADDSSVYVMNTSMLYGTYVTVYGEYSATGNEKHDIGGGVTYVPPNSVCYITQYCYEWGYPYLHICFSVIDNRPAGGWWSPDSV